MIKVPPQGLSLTTTLNVNLDPTKLNVITQSFPFAAPVAPNTPAITSVQVQNDGTTPPILIVKGTGFDIDPNGPSDQIQVLLTSPDSATPHRFQVSLSPVVGGTASEIHVQLPTGEAIGTLLIQVEPQVLRHYAADPQQASVQLNVNTNYVFTALGDTSQVAVINDDETSANFTQIVARIPVGPAGQASGPNDVAITPDNTRAYVTMRFVSSIAVVDALQLVRKVAEIKLPAGSDPLNIVMDPFDTYAYVSDFNAYNGMGAVYVIDVNPASPTYNTVVQTISVGPAPAGLRQLTLDADGKRLYVVARGSMYAIMRCGQPGSSPAVFW